MNKEHVPTQKMLDIMQAVAHAYRDSQVFINDEDFIRMVFMAAIDIVALERGSPGQALHQMIKKIGDRKIRDRNSEEELVAFILNMEEVKALLAEEVH